MTTPQPGDRRPREGRCVRCDRPLTDETWSSDEGQWQWDPDYLPDDTRCAGWPVLCRGPSVDWRARCLQAEADVNELLRRTAANMARRRAERAALLPKETT